MSYDVVIVGGGPAGLAAALTLGRARKRVLLCDAGPRRNAAAVHVHNFVTRDGITPSEFRRIGRQQLEFGEGPPLERDAIFLHPGQRQIALVAGIGLTLDAAGYVQVDGATLATSVPGIYAAGDLITPKQGALIAAASGTLTAARINHSLTVELAVAGALP